MTEHTESERYENPELWDRNRFTPEDHVRAAETAAWVPLNAASVLDVGCGNGLLTERLRHERFAVGVDRSRYALMQFSAPRSRADVTALPFADGTFDCVVCAEVIEHLPLSMYRAALREMARVAKRYILITVPYCEDLLSGHVVCPACHCRFNANYHLRSFDERALRLLFQGQPEIRLARLAGLVPEQTRRLNRLWATLLLVRYDLLGAPDLAPHMQCPHCGYSRLPDVHVTQPAVAPRLGVAATLNRLWPKRKAYRWWIALYEKPTP